MARAIQVIVKHANLDLESSTLTVNSLARVHHQCVKNHHLSQPLDYLHLMTNRASTATRYLFATDSRPKHLIWSRLCIEEGHHQCHQEFLPYWRRSSMNLAVRLLNIDHFQEEHHFTRTLKVVEPHVSTASCTVQRYFVYSLALLKDIAWVESGDDTRNVQDVWK